MRAMPPLKRAHSATRGGGWRRTRRALLVLSGLCGVVALAVDYGALGGVGADRAIMKGDALICLGIYWALACFVIVVRTGLRHNRRQTVMLLVAFVGAYLSAEVVLRLTYPPSWERFQTFSSPEFHHMGGPGLDMFWGEVEGTRIYVTTNEDGLRSSYSREEFRDHRDRVVAMGDSFTFGNGVRQDKALPQVMERLLREQLGRDDIAVLNAGQTSFSPLLAGRLFDSVIHHYEPTLVLYFLDATDIGDDYSYAKELVHTEDGSHFDLPGSSAPRYYGAVGHLLNLGELVQQMLKPFRWAAFRMAGVPMPTHYNWYSFGTHIKGQLETNRYFIYRHPLEDTIEYFEATLGHIRSLAAAARAVGADFQLVVTPRFHHWSRRECPRNWEAGQYALDEPYQFEYFRFFEERAPSLPFEIYDLLPKFQATSEFPLCFEMDPHWNDAGHAFVARVMADQLIGTGRLD